MFELLGALALPVLISMAPGLWAFFTGRPYAGVALMALGLIFIGVLAYLVGFAALVSSIAMPLIAMWLVAALFCPVSGGVVVALGPERR